MKHPVPFAGLAAAGGAAALVLRRLQCATGIESGTGLPIPGNPYALALPILLAGLAVLFALLVRTLPADGGRAALPFSAHFRATGTLPVFLLIAGLFLTVFSGAADVALGLLYQGSLDAMLPDGSTLSVVIMTGQGILSPRVSIVLGVLAIVAAASLFPIAKACRRAGRGDAPAVNGNLLLVPVIVLVVRLVMTYRADSVNPALSTYYVELLALTFLILSLFRLSAFAFSGGRTRRFAWDAMAAAALCLATLGDRHGLGSMLLYAGGALTQLAFLSMRLESAAQESL